MIKTTDERILILHIVNTMTNEVIPMSDEERLDLLIDLTDGERDLLISLCSRIITTAADGRNIKLKQLEKRYADQIK